MTARDRNELILADMIAARAACMPDLDVMTFVSIDPSGTLRDEVRTYRELWDNGRRLAQALDEERTPARGAVALLMRNHPAFIETMIAASITGAIIVPVDARVRGEQLEFMLNFAECEGAIVGDYALSNLLEVRAKLPRLRWIWVLSSGNTPERRADVRDVSELLSRRVPDLDVRVKDPDEPQQLLFTSGTTGDPKAILAPYRRFGESARLGPLFGLTPHDRPYTGLSLTHANAQFVTVASALHSGLRVVVSERFTKTRLWDIVRRYGCTVFTLLGGMTTALYSKPRRRDDADNPVRMVISAGMPTAIWDDFRERFGVEIFEFYGAAEGGLTLNPPRVGPVGSVGKPLPDFDLAILDGQGQRCPPGVAGEICFRPHGGTARAVQYFKNPQASLAKTADGWLRMGDIGHVDAQGWLYFHHRAGGGIRRNGEFIDAAFVESTLATHPDVADVFVYGVPATSGSPGEQDLIAAIVPTDANRIDPGGLFEYCHRRLGSNGVPSQLQIVEEIPKTVSEKPQQRVLAAALTEPGAKVYSI